MPVSTMAMGHEHQVSKKPAGVPVAAVPLIPTAMLPPLWCCHRQNYTRQLICFKTTPTTRRKY